MSHQTNERESYEVQGRCPHCMGTCPGPQACSPGFADTAVSHSSGSRAAGFYDFDMNYHLNAQHYGNPRSRSKSKIPSHRSHPYQPSHARINNSRHPVNFVPASNRPREASATYTYPSNATSSAAVPSQTYPTNAAQWRGNPSPPLAYPMPPMYYSNPTPAIAFPSQIFLSHTTQPTPPPPPPQPNLNAELETWEFSSTVGKPPNAPGRIKVVVPNHATNSNQNTQFPPHQRHPCRLCFPYLEEYPLFECCHMQKERDLAGSLLMNGGDHSQQPPVPGNSSFTQYRYPPHDPNRRFPWD